MRKIIAVLASRICCIRATPWRLLPHSPPGTAMSAIPKGAAGASAILLAAGIFLLDTFSPLEFAVAVLYAVVVMVLGIACRRRTVLLAAGGCGVLTVVSYLLVHGAKATGTAPIRAVVSLAAIGVTTSLMLRNLTANGRLRESERQRANLARFFPPHLVDQLMEIDTPLSMTRQQPAAVLFVDMVGFTAYCARMRPEAVISMLRDLLARLSASVFANNGTIDKFLGDGLMAVFGAPLPSPADVTNAVRAALEIQRSIACWNAERHEFGEAPIHVAVGIHYGDVVHGDVGSDRQLELTVVGDTVNIASHVEAYCRLLDASVLITGAVMDALFAEGSDALAREFADEGHHLLHGRSEPIHLYRAAGGRPR
jgi:class 3 adenylate cyclase